MSEGHLLLSAAVPVQRYKQVLGALMLTRDNRAIAASLREVRYDMLTIAVAALGITVLLSLYLAGTITQPIVRLARAADEIRLARESRPEIPDLGKRGDEIGDLNDALRSMTDALWQRINTIESFAADVAHELKNPLTSLRSAIEVAARPNLEAEQRAKLMAIVVHDIERLNRLISDISDASRLDAELMRGEFKAVDLKTLLSDMVQHYATVTAQKAGVEVELRLSANPPYEGHRPRRPLRPGVPQHHRQRPVVQPEGLAHPDRAQPRGAQRSVRHHDRRRGPGHSRGQSRIDLPALLLRAAERAFRPALGAGPVDLPPDHGDLRRLDHRQQPQGAPTAASSAPASPCASRRRRDYSSTRPDRRPAGQDASGVPCCCAGRRARASRDLALRLIEAGGRLVADDQTHLARRGRSLVATPPPALAGMIEARGVGIVRLQRNQLLAQARVALLVDLVPPERIERLPEPQTETLIEITVPRLDLAPFEASAVAKVVSCLDAERSRIIVGGAAMPDSPPSPVPIPPTHHTPPVRAGHRPERRRTRHRPARARRPGLRRRRQRAPCPCSAT